jgi:Zn-finger protein
MNNYCENEKQVRPFILRRSNEGTVWECENCHYVVRDLSKYKDNYNGLPAPEERPKQPKIL